MTKKKGTVTAVIPKPTSKYFVDRLSKSVKTEIVADTQFIPQYKTDGAACCDLVANIPPDINGERTLKLMPGHTVVIDTGIKVAVPVGYEAEIRPRSGLSSKGVVVGGGTIDSDYRDTVFVVLIHGGKHILNINHLDRIAQMAIRPVSYFDFSVVEKLPEADSNRTGGLGSTGN